MTSGASLLGARVRIAPGVDGDAERCEFARE
jgi:hypothetical protein